MRKHSFLFYTAITLIAAILTPLAKKQIQTEKVSREKFQKIVDIEISTAPSTEE